MNFKVGDCIKVIKPDPKDPFYLYWCSWHEGANGLECKITSLYQAYDVTTGQLETWVTLSGSAYGFHSSWLQVTNQGPSANQCQCDIAKLMAKGCQCGSFKSEKK